jgi:hypothetical protein
MDSAVLQSLADKQAIYEVLQRYCRGIDRMDMALVRAAFHPDAIDNHVGYAGPVEGFITFVEAALRRLVGSSHTLCGHLAEIDGDVAVCETYAIAAHWGEPADEPMRNLTMGLRYVDYMARRNGVWAIQERWVAVDWARSNVGQPRLNLPGPVGSRGPDDPLTALRRRMKLD